MEEEQKRDVSPKRKRVKKVAAETTPAEPVKTKKKQVKKKAEPKTSNEAKPKAAGTKVSDLEMAIRLLQGNFHEAALELLLAMQKNATKKRAAPKKKKEEVVEKE
jgi:hypothetical protein